MSEETQDLTLVPNELMDEITAKAREHDEDLLVVALLYGSEPRGLGLSMWTALPGPNAADQAADLLLHSLGADRDTWRIQ